MSKRFSIPGVLDLAHQFVQLGVERTPTSSPRFAVDTTVGNGHDTAWLAKCVGLTGRVVGCDIQESALVASRERLAREGLSDRVTLLHTNHADLHQHLTEEWFGQVSAVMANLGYLPGADKTLITRKETTLAMIETMLPYLRLGGVMTTIVYGGHPGGLEEADAVSSYIHSLPPTEWRVIHAAFPNQANRPPELLAVERLI